MGLHMVKAVPTPEEIRAAHPMDKELQEIKAKEMLRLRRYLPVNPISLSQSLVLVQQIMRIRCSIISADWQLLQRRSRIRFCNS